MADARREGGVLMSKDVFLVVVGQGGQKGPKKYGSSGAS